MIIFDFDGVLADSLESCLSACNVAARAQGAEWAFEQDAFATLNPLTFEALAERHGLQPEPFARDVAAAVSANPDVPAVFDGICDALSDLAQTHALIVVSASHASVIRSVLKASDADRHFARIVGGDTPGSKAEKISELVADKTAERHVMVGDAVSDILAARAAGIGAIGVCWGWQASSQLLAHDPDAIAQTPQDLAQVCRSVLDA